MPLQQTSGNVTADAYGGGVAAKPNYIEDVFSTYLYTGNDSTQTITNGIDLSTKGGMVWTKSRSNAQQNWIFDTSRGPNSPLMPNSNGNVSDNYTTYFSPATNIVLGTTTGYSLAQTTGGTNTNNYTYVGWTFRKQPKFFDIVTFTGTGSTQTIAHNLGSVPGCIIVKDLESGYNWQVYHRSLTSAAYSIQLNQTAAQSSQPTIWNSTAPTSTNFTVGTSPAVNGAGKTFVAYIYAHNSGGFGLAGTDNVISCGSYTSPTSGTTDVNLGYEPQFLLLKSSSASTNWEIVDTMRGFNNSGNSKLSPDTSDAESVYTTPYFFPTATGFSASTGFFGAGSTVIYIAIRRGPMKVPTDATKVFAPVAYTGTGAASQAITTGFVPDVVWWKKRTSATNWRSATLLAGFNSGVSQNLTAAEEYVAGYYISSYQNTGYTYGASDASYNTSGQTYIADGFSRAPSFFDVVCYTGTATAGQTYTHNLGVAPELMIIKSRSAERAWQVYSANLTTAYYLTLNSTNAQVADGGGGDWYGTAPTSTVFSVGTNFTVNNVGETYVAYLFATCAGVSKVGSYTGNGSTQAIACGFAGGARFVLIKRTDSTGDWYTYDTARGMTTLTDPYLLLNSTAAESATLGSVTTTTGGFTVNSAILAAINTSSATYIFLAIA